MPSSAPAFVGNRFASRAESDRDRAALEELYDKAERAHPKSTARNPLYQNFGQKKQPGAAMIYSFQIFPCAKNSIFL